MKTGDKVHLAWRTGGYAYGTVIRVEDEHRRFAGPRITVRMKKDNELYDYELGVDGNWYEVNECQEAIVIRIFDEEQGDPDQHWFRNWTEHGRSSLSNAGFIPEDDQEKFMKRFDAIERWAVDGCHILLHLKEGRALLCKKETPGKKRGRGRLPKLPFEEEEERKVDWDSLVDIVVEVKYVAYVHGPNQQLFKRFYLSVKRLKKLLEDLHKMPEKRWRFPALMLYPEDECNLRPEIVREQ